MKDELERGALMKDYLPLAGAMIPTLVVIAAALASFAHDSSEVMASAAPPPARSAAPVVAEACGPDA